MCPVTATWSPRWEGVPGSVSAPWVRLPVAVKGVLGYSPKPQTDIIISLHAKMQVWFYFNIIYDAACFILGVIGFHETLAMLARLPGAQEFKDALSFLSEVLPDWLCLQVSMESRHCPGRSEVRSRVCFPASES